MLFPKPRNLKNKLIQEEVDILPGEAPNKPSLFGKIGKFFKSEDIPQGTDELGIEKPSIHKESGFRKLLNYAVPATLGLASGVGVLPGLASAYYGKKSENADKENLLREAYQKERQEKIKANEVPDFQKKFNFYGSLSPEDQNKFLELNAPGQVLGAPVRQQEKEESRNLKMRDDEMAFRKEYSGNPVVKEYNEANLGINKIRQAANSKDKTGFNDQALIFNFMKVLDPGSVVREGEYATAAKNASIFDRLGISVQKVMAGQQLSEDQRKKILQAADLQFKANQDRFKQFKGSMSKIAQDSGLDPAKVMPEFESGDEDQTIAGVKQWIKENPNDPRAQQAIQKLIKMGAF